MEKFVIIADSTCDLTEEFQKKYDIEIIFGHLMLPGKKEMKSFLKWETVSMKDFYTSLRKDPASFTTAPASIDEYAEAFEKHVAQGEAVLSMSISGALSGSHAFSCKAREQVLEKYPDAKIYCFDSLRYGPGFGLLAVYASMKRSEGLTFEQTCEWLEENKQRFHQVGWLDDLSFVAKKGRLTHAKAFFGTLAGIKPIGEIDATGLTTIIGKIKGAKSAYAVLLMYINEIAENLKEQTVFIAQSDRLAQAEAYKKMIEDKFSPKEVIIMDTYPSSGINVGPGLMGAYFMGKPITKDLEYERGLIEKFTKEVESK